MPSKFGGKWGTKCLNKWSEALKKIRTTKTTTQSSNIKNTVRVEIKNMINKKLYLILWLFAIDWINCKTNT